MDFDHIDMGIQWWSPICDLKLSQNWKRTLRFYPALLVLVVITNVMWRELLKWREKIWVWALCWLHENWGLMVSCMVHQVISFFGDNLSHLYKNRLVSPLNNARNVRKFLVVCHLFMVLWCGCLFTSRSHCLGSTVQGHLIYAPDTWWKTGKVIWISELRMLFHLLILFG